ncbi:type II toxin-antitoxin system VapC family toxin [Methylobacterium sp. BTF04]|uniref:type II toxin-antitoxin system VapC family toxin n=1 Tax=Methylobacterium sp. BTF04 TaxID=2708300 RepID=UPI0013D13CCD|nr:type II toxin-antitoxin system VapC family toxin [Methylobacterium sp. BTF04]NEU12307.1 type II toxin-antitoxin system VapC family toxin [Methylobacterium sp. BTF04]
MIALDTSALVAIALCEPEEEAFNRVVAARTAVVGAPTLVETRMVLESRIPETAAEFLLGFTRSPSVTVLAFDAAMYELACSAFARFGKGRGRPAQLNFGDCLSYAVAKSNTARLLFKGDDFSRTDILPVFPLDR